ncbi:MAG: TetR/AcrR family transcriptional regulator [Alphaproteobacteria bacterium]|nr:TetR/AcrR family transcriptional regulator [Alphaproteobacteria bacterium]MBL7098218.1 TetR/AcrR family transcriptional regulator [Alphaproteobacteria bacterium]
MATQTRDLLVAAAAKLLDSGGPAAVTLRDVGKVAGVSHNAPYKHFANKEELLAAVASRELTRQGKNLGDIGARGGRPVDQLRAMMRGYVRWATAHPERFKLTFGRWDRGTDELADAASTASANLSDLIVKAQAAGELPEGNPDHLAGLILSLAHGAADRAIGGHLSAKGKGKTNPEDIVDVLFVTLTRAAKR